MCDLLAGCEGEDDDYEVVASIEVLSVKLHAKAGSVVRRGVGS